MYVFHIFNFTFPMATLLRINTFNCAGIVDDARRAYLYEN